MAENDYGPKTGASVDRPYNQPETHAPVSPAPAGKDKSTPPDANTEVDSEANLADPSGT